MNTKTQSWVDHADLSVINQGLLQNQEVIEKQLSLVMFEVQGEFYAVPIDQVKEVVATPTITPIPQSPAYILGVGNIRGNVLALIDLTQRIFTETGTDESVRYTMVLNSTEYMAGFLISTVPKALKVKESQINTSTSVIQNLGKEDQFIAGVIKTEDRIVILVNLSDMLV